MTLPDHSLYLRAKEGDREAITEIMDQQNGLVWYLAWKNKRQDLDIMDLVQFGRMGILRAINSFDPSRGFLFSTYARKCVHQFIWAGANDFRNIVWIPPKKRETTHINKICIDAFVDGDEEGASVEKFFISLVPLMLDTLVAEEEIRFVHDCLALLTEKHQKVIKMRYGLGCEPMTQYEIAKEMGTSHQNIALYQNAAERELSQVGRLRNFQMGGA